MRIKRITANVYELPLGYVNAFLVEDDDLTLIDTGAPGNAGKILKAVREMGRDPEEIRHILLTHGHPDHAGSAAELKAITGAKVYMHAAEVPHVEEGRSPRPQTPYFTGIVNKTLYQVFVKRASGQIPPLKIDATLEDGDWLPIASGIHVIHIPGHSPAQLAFFIPGQKNVLFVADAAANIMGLGYSCFYEDFSAAVHSLEKLSTFDFDVACFGHGRTILHEAANRFRNKFLKQTPRVSHQAQYLVLEENTIIRLKEPEERI